MVQLRAAINIYCLVDRVIAVIWYFSLFFFLSVIFFSDVLYRKVRNKVIAIALFWFVAYALLRWSGIFSEGDAPVVTLQDSIFGFVGGLLIFYPLWLKKIMGAGDVKFIAVLGVVLGWQITAWVVLLSGLLAGPHALVQVLQIKKDGPHKKIERRGVPYAGYIALTAIIWLIWKLLE